MSSGEDDSSVASGASASSSLSKSTAGNSKKAAATQNVESEEVQRLIWKETRNVHLSRSFLLLLILAVTTVLVTLAYAVFNNQDRDELALAVRTNVWMPIDRYAKLRRIFTKRPCLRHFSSTRRHR
jgi:hypothetical protein